MAARRLAHLKDALVYGRISKSKFYRLIEAGELEAFKDGKLTFVDLNSIDRYHAALPKLVLHRKKTK